MNKYESVIVIKPNLSKNIYSEISLKTENKINEFATVIKKEDLGQRTLAYDIKNSKQGYYLTFQFEIDDFKGNEIKELEDFYRSTEEILKYIIVKN